MKVEYLSKLADIVVSIDEGKDITDANIVNLTDHGIRLIAEMRSSGVPVGCLQEIFGGIQLMCGNRVALPELIDVAHEEIARLLDGAAWRVYGYEDGWLFGGVFGALTYENKKLNDHVGGSFIRTEKQVQSVSLGLSGEFQDNVNGGGRTLFDMALYAGRLSMDAKSHENDDLNKSNGDFFKSTYMVNRLQRLTDRDKFAITFSGQLASANLNSSEKYSLGGVYGVRAYPQGEASGDVGNTLNFELTHSFTPKLQGVLFYDYGHIKVNYDNYTAGADNARTIAGAGVGVNAELFGRLQLYSYLAWRTQGGTPLSEPSSAERTPRLWVQLSGEF